MNKIEKLLRKISQKDRGKILFIIEKLINNPQDAGLDIKKLQASDFYRLRQGRFRIIFHYDNKQIIIDSIKLRQEDTYSKI